MKKLYSLLSFTAACGLLHIATDNVIVLGAANALFVFNLATIGMAALISQPAFCPAAVSKKKN